MTGRRSGELTGRDWERRHFDQMLAAPDGGGLWLIEGPGGIGKSALIAQLATMCMAARRPYLRLDVRDGIAAEGEEVLKELCRGGTGLDRLRALSDGDVWTWLDTGEAVEGHLSKLWDSVKDVLLDQLKPEQQSHTGLIAQLLKITAGVVFGERARLAKRMQAELKAQPEKVLLGNLADEGRRRPVLLIDTFEHLLAGEVSVNSRLDLDLALSGQLAPVPKSQTQSAERFLASMIRVLMGRGWTVVVAGRRLTDLLRQLSENVHHLLGLPVETIANEWLNPLWLRHKHAGTDESVTLNLARWLHVSSFGGNPLWLNALIAVQDNLLMQGVLPAKLADNRELEIGMNALPLGGVLAHADAVRCKADILEVLFRGEKMDMTRAWRLALPDRLDRRRLQALFPNDDEGDRLLRRLGEIGLFAGARHRPESQLHEEVRDLLLWWGQSHGLMGTADTRSDYRALLSTIVLERPDLASIPSDIVNRPVAEQIKLMNGRFVEPKDVAWSREAIKYACLASERLALDSSPVDGIQFHAALSGSPSLGVGEKWRAAAAIETLTDRQVFLLIETWTDELQQWSDIFGNDIAQRLSRDNRLGLISQVGDVPWWLRCISDEGHRPEAYLGLFQTQSSASLQAHGIDAERSSKLMHEMLSHALTTGRGNERALAEAMRSIAAHIVQMGSHEQAIEIYGDVIDRFGSTNEAALLEQVAKALFYKGVTLGKAGKHEQALQVYVDLIDRFGSGSEPARLIVVAMALFNKGFTLGQMGKDDQAIEVYDDLIDRFGSASESAILEQVAKALLNKGFNLGRMRKYELAIQLYGDMINRFGSASEPALLEPVAKALFDKGVTLGLMDKNEQAIQVYGDLIDRFGSAREPALLIHVARALFNKGSSLDRMGKNEQVIQVYDDLIDRFGTASELSLAELVAEALLYKGSKLGQMGKNEQAIKTYDDLIDRFGSANEPAILATVAKALSSKGFELVFVGKVANLTSKRHDAWQQAKSLFERALRLCEPGDRAVVLGNLAYTTLLLGDKTRGQELLTAALSIGGEDLYRGTLDDLSRHRIPEDEAVRTMLDACWSTVRP